MQTFIFVLLISLFIATNAFQSLVSRSRRISYIRAEEVTQSIQDLNLEDMFEVFEAADSSVPASAIPKGLAGSEFIASKAVGTSEPLGFFDPAGFTIDASESLFKFYQEAEIKHGRIAMLAFVGIFFGETSGFLLGNSIVGPAIYQIQQVGDIIPSFWFNVAWVIGLTEVKSIKDAWEPLSETSGLTNLKPTHIPGNLNFDPLDLAPKNVKAAEILKLKEINNGRLAMIAVIGIIVQEAISATSTF